MSPEEHNALGFHYLVKWRRHELVTTDSAYYDERTVDAGSNTLTIEGQSIYKPYEIYVLAINEVGEAASAPRVVIGYSGEDGKFYLLNVGMYRNKYIIRDFQWSLAVLELIQEVFHTTYS